MRRFWLALAIGVLALLTSGAALAGDKPAMTAKASSFELFGTSFCFVDPGASADCDVVLSAPSALASPPVAGDGASVYTLWGVTFCGELTPLGPACDVAWLPPVPAAPWRDFPELRVLALLP
jgi:hypothetical protein